MNSSSTRDTEVLIVGAGPTGLVLALWLTRLGVRVRIVDKRAEVEATSRAIGVQARTLELYRQFGIADEVVERGRKALAGNLWVAGRNRARFSFNDMGKGLSPFPYALVLSQDEHERLLVGHLTGLGIEIERRTELLGFEETAGGVVARLKRADGATETCEAAYIAGCDGAHSIVRETLGVGFAGGTYDHLFYVADVKASGPGINGDIHISLDAADFLVIFPLKGEGRARFVGTMLEDAEHRQESVGWKDVNKRVIEGMHINIEGVNWFSTYRVHHRVAEHFRKGRAFLLGDAAHIHSPVGGQGMNTGIGDAVNLAWKLAAVLRGRADEALLESYEPERTAFARRLVETTDRVFTGVTSAGAMDRWVRLHLVPFLLPTLFKFKAVRHLMFRTVSQAVVNYRGSSLSEGRAGEVHGGDRLPWVKAELNGGDDNFAPLTSLDWQVHVYGIAAPEVQAVCDERKLPLHVFPWRREMSRAGLRRNAVYLLRPDGYVALVNSEGSAEAVTSYLDARKLVPTGQGFKESRRV
jgi:2-polyprenyl-6-methoxyphenol hydroxylase-like FAD-dependent oxidoreductase